MSKRLNYPDTVWKKSNLKKKVKPNDASIHQIRLNSDSGKQTLYK